MKYSWVSRGWMLPGRIDLCTKGSLYVAHEIEGLHLTHPSHAIRAYRAATNHSASRERRQRKTGWYPSLEQRERWEEVAHMSPLGVTVSVPYN